MDISESARPKEKLLFVCPRINKFIQNDIDILAKDFDVRLNCYPWKKKWLIPALLIYQLFSILWSILSIRKIFIEFGGYWSLIPSIIGKIFRKPVFIVLHGTDCASMPSINYGSLRKKLIKLFCGISYENATQLLPVSNSLVFVINDYNFSDKYQGFKHFFPKLKTGYKVIPNGLDINYWTPSPRLIKESNSFIAVFSENQFILKGGDLILELSYLFPNCTFSIAGLDQPKELTNIPDNLLFLGRLSSDELRSEYQKARYHLQLSMFEGFGLSLCEAMLSEAVPIGSEVNIIPEIINQTGWIVKKRCIKELELVVKDALSSTDLEERGKKARARIISKYSGANRETLIKKSVLDGAIRSHNSH